MAKDTNWLDEYFTNEVSPPLLNPGTGSLPNVATLLNDGNKASAVRFSNTAPDVSGLRDGTDGRRIHLIAAGGPIIIREDSSLSDAANRIKTGVGDVTIAQGAAAWCVYDATAQRWFLSSGSGGGGGGGGTRLNWFNVLDYGAVADGTTDNVAAFRAAIAASGVISPYEGGTPSNGGAVYIPPGEPHEYYFADDLHISRSIEMFSLGSVLSAGGAILKFAPGKGIVLESAGTSPDTGGGQLAGYYLHGFALQCQPLALNKLLRNTAYTLGQQVRIKNDNRFVLTCTTAGTTHATTSPFGGETWDPHAGDYSPSAVNRGEFAAITDGTVVWTLSVAAGIKSYGFCQLENLYISGTGGPAISLYGSTADFTLSANSFSRLINIFIQQCGLGVWIYGGDAGHIYASHIDIIAAGYPYDYEEPGIGVEVKGGFGWIDHAFYGSKIDGMSVSDCTGPSIWAVPSVTSTTLTNLYVEGAIPSPWSNGLHLGGEWGAVDNFPGTGLSLDQGWRNMRSLHLNSVKQATVTVDDRVTGTFGFWARTSLDYDLSSGGFCERYYDHSVASDGLVKGEWVTGLSSILLFPSQRRITGYTGGNTFAQGLHKMGGSAQGVGNWRNFRGEFRGDGAKPYYVGYDAGTTIIGDYSTSSQADQFVRFEQGVSGHRYPGDRFELGDTDQGFGGAGDVGLVVYAEGWQAPRPWHTTLTPTPYDQRIGGSPTEMIHPVTPNGYSYVATKSGAASGTTEPTWPTTFLVDSSDTTGTYVNGGVVPYAWHALMTRRVGDYGAPNPRNGHWYKVTAVSSPDEDGYGLAGGAPPTWPTGSGATVTDGQLTWKEMGSDVGTYVTDAGTEWQCVGPEPKYRNYGTRTWVPYDGGEATETVIGYYESDGTTLNKLVSVTSGAHATLGDSTKGLVINGSSVEIETSGGSDAIDLTTTSTGEITLAAPVLNVDTAKIVAGASGPGFSGLAVQTSERATVGTANATITNAYTWTIPVGVTSFMVEITAVKTDDSTSAIFGRKTRYQNHAGTVTQGASIDTGSDADSGLSTATVTVDFTGTTGRVRVTGVAATNITWDVVVTRIERS